jgi:hypothetical protein
MKPQRVRCKLGETIEQPCSDLLTHTLKMCKGAHLYNRYSTSKDGHDSYGMFTTSAECKTVITVVLTVMSGMDPHMISGNAGFGLVWLGCRSGFLLGCGSVTVRLHDAIEVRTLRR